MGKNVVNNTYKNKLASLNTMPNKGNDLNIVNSEVQGITKLRERFQFQTSREDKNVDNVDMKQPETKRVSRMINKDLLKKFDCPEMAQELKIQRDKDREERRLQRIAQLEEEKRLEEERRKEAIRLEQERLEELRLEQLRIEEEQSLEKILPDPTYKGDRIVRVGSLKGKSDGIFAS